MPISTPRSPVLVLCLVAAVLVATAVGLRDADSRRDYLLTHAPWPVDGQAAYVLGNGPAQISPRQRAVPIASLAKIMTAYVVLHRFPLAVGQRGFTLTVTAADVADTARRADRDESLVPVRAGERLTERDALAALMLPSANNVAIMLATWVSGSVSRFVAHMNAAAADLGMWHTNYTDPSGFDVRTRSTAADQLVLARAAMHDRFFRELVGQDRYDLPVAGTVRNTDVLLGRNGFAGIKTGSMDASGGCFAFLSRRLVGGLVVELYGVVLGQHGDDLVLAGQYAASQLADRVAPEAATTGGS